MKKLIILLLLVSLSLSVLTGCKNADEAKEAKKEAQTQDLLKDLKKNDNIDPNAKINTTTDEQGNPFVTYENPDGTSGGGVALD